jgi:hypothetical protein
MSSINIVQLRLQNQHISNPHLTNPTHAVDYLGAVQAQDFAGAKWALGLRIPGVTDSEIERSFNEGAILRTHILRPTWHFVTPADIRWMLALTAPRVHAINGTMYRKLELDSTIFKRCNAVLVKTLSGGQHLTRDELRDVLQRAGIDSQDNYRMSYLVMQAELDGIICSGPRRGKQFTYALLDERAPDPHILERNEALAELAGRYFLSRGPATVHDFAKWSGLTLADARLGLEAVQAQLQSEEIDGRTYWFPRSPLASVGKSPTAYLLSVYDEYISGYKGLHTVANDETAAKLNELGNALAYILYIDGQVVGTWKRTFRKDSVLIQPNLFRALDEVESHALTAAAQKYGDFLELQTLIV